MVNTMRQLLTKKKLTLLLISVVLNACVSNNRPNNITSIGIEDLTQKKAVNAIIFDNLSPVVQEKTNNFDQAAKDITNALKEQAKANKIRLNNTATYTGDWLDVADLHFNDADYNWTLRFWDSNLPKLGFQNFSTDIDSSIEVHFRYCKERTIQFANISESQLSKDREYWLKHFYPAAIHSLYLLMKGNIELAPIQVKAYGGRLVSGTKLGESEHFIFVLNGETEIFIVPKLNVNS